MSTKTPSFASGSTLTIHPIKEIKQGGSSNSYQISLSNHLGTHVDAPKHIDDLGKSISEYSLEGFIFANPRIIDVPKGESELVQRSDLELHKKEIAQADLLLLRTGFQKYRISDVQQYMNRNPGVSPSAAQYLISFPDLRALGMDLISLSAVHHREEGRIAHHNLLSGRDFFIIEDMDLAMCPMDLKRVIIAPLFVVGVDSTPCTVIAET